MISLRRPKIRSLHAVLLAVGVLARVPAVRANLIINGSFETGGFFDNTGQVTVKMVPGDTRISGWTVVGASPGADVAWTGPQNPFSTFAGEGDYYLDLTGYHDRVPYGGVSQAIPTVIGQTYKVSFQIGSDTTFNGALRPSVAVTITGNGTTVRTVDSVGHSRWQSFELSFVATQPLTTLEFTGGNTEDIIYIGLDNVSVVPATETNLVVNGSFELGSFVDNSGSDTMLVKPGETPIAGWTVVDADPAHNVAWEGPSTPYGVWPGSGNYFLDLTGFSDAIPYAGVSQTMDTTIGQTYELSFELGSAARYDGTVLPSVVVSLTGLGSFTRTVSAVGESRWQSFRVPFTATTTKTVLTITGNDAFPNLHIGLDTVSVIRTGSPPAVLLNVPEATDDQVKVKFQLLSGFASSFTLLQAATVAGPWTPNPTAVLTSPVPGVQYYFTTPRSGPTGFYRVVAQ